MAVKKDKNIQNLDTVGAYYQPVTPSQPASTPKTTSVGGTTKTPKAMAAGLNDQNKYFVDDMGNTASPTDSTNEAYLRALYSKPIQGQLPQNNNTAGGGGGAGGSGGGGGGGYGGYYIPTYTSPTAGAQYSYGGTRPTWSWDQTEPTYSWNQQAPTWSWDDSGRPGAFEWDDSGRPGEFTYDQAAPAYTNAYQDKINAMVDQILNRPNFSYDYTQDPLYAQYADAYTRNGTQAMNDTLAQVSARTGGLASSYASNAAQQQYNSYMSALNDKIPELYQLAYGMYQDQGNTMRNNLSMLQGLENTDYGRYVDALNQYNTDRNLAYNVWNSGLNQYNNDRNFAYNQYADQLAQYNQDRNFSYGQYQDALNQYNTDRNFSYGQYQDALNQYNNNRNFDYGVYADALSQYNTDRNWDYNLWADNIARQEAAAKAAYNSQVAQARAAAGGSGSSGSSNVIEEQNADWNSPYNDLRAAGIKTEEEAMSYLIDVRGYNATTAAALAKGFYSTMNNGSSNQSANRQTPKTEQQRAREAYNEDPDQYDYGVWSTPSGYEFMGKTYKDKNSVMNAVASANISNDTYLNALGMMLTNGIISQAEYNELKPKK